MLDAAASSVQVTHSLCNHLAEMGCEVHVFTAPHWLRTTSSVDSKMIYYPHVSFYRGTQMRSYEARNVPAKLFWRLVRLVQHVCAMISICLAARHFDVIHTQILPIPILDYFFLCFIARRTPVVCTVHELVPHNTKWRRLTGAFVRGIYQRADLLFFYTEYTGNRLIEELAIPPKKIFKVPHGNLEHLLRLKPDPVKSESDPVVLFIGQIRRDKGVDTLVRAAAHLRDKIPNFKLRIAGNPGFDMASIFKLTRELGLQEIIEFRLGYLPEQDFAEYLNKATVVALPYRRIEQSGVAIAACTLGKALVGTRCGGVEELITEAGNGLLVPVDDPVAFADALALLLQDGSKRRYCEVQSEKYASGALSWGPIASKTINGYQIALKQRAPAAAPALTEPS